MVNNNSFLASTHLKRSCFYCYYQLLESIIMSICRKHIATLQTRQQALELMKISF